MQCYKDEIVVKFLCMLVFLMPATVSAQVFSGGDWGLRYFFMFLLGFLCFFRTVVAIIKKIEGKHYKPIELLLIIVFLLSSIPWIINPDFDKATLIIVVSFLLFFITFILLIVNKIKKAFKIIFIVIPIVFLILMTNESVLTIHKYEYIKENPLLVNSKVAEYKYLPEMKLYDSLLFGTSDGRVFFNLNEKPLLNIASLPVGTKLVIKKINSNECKENNCYSVSALSRKLVKHSGSYFDFQNEEGLKIADKTRLRSFINIPLKRVVVDPFYMQNMAYVSLYINSEGVLQDDTVLSRILFFYVKTLKDPKYLVDLMVKGADPNFLNLRFDGEHVSTFYFAIENFPATQISDFLRFGGNPEVEIKGHTSRLYYMNGIHAALKSSVSIDETKEKIRLLVENNNSIKRLNRKNESILDQVILDNQITNKYEIFQFLIKLGAPFEDRHRFRLRYTVDAALLAKAEELDIMRSTRYFTERLEKSINHNLAVVESIKKISLLVNLNSEEN